MHRCVHAVFPQAHNEGLCLSHLGLPSAQRRYLQGIGNQISVCPMNKYIILIQCPAFLEWHSYRPRQKAYLPHSITPHHWPRLE